MLPWRLIYLLRACICVASSESNSKTIKISRENFRSFKQNNFCKEIICCILEMFKAFYVVLNYLNLHLHRYKERLRYDKYRCTYVMLCAIWYHFYNLKNVKNNHEGVLLLLKSQAKCPQLH